MNKNPSHIVVQHDLVRAFFYTILRASGNLREAVKEEEGEAAVGTIHRRGKAAAAYGLLLAKKST